jgi:arginyl-tRNA synthetase
MAHLLDVYRKANERAEKDPEFDERARAFFRRMEANDPEAMALWKELRAVSIAGFRAIYARLGIEFQHYDGESLYQGRMEAVISEVDQKIGTKESQGALIVDMPYPEGEPPVMLKKKDGSTLYATRDLAAAEDRYERFHFDRSLYIVAQDQALHFRQFFAVLERLGKPWAKDLVHVNFGRVKGMSTRGGNLVMLSDVLDEAVSRARAKVDENIAAGKIQTESPQDLAEQIGLGAIVFGDLKNRRTSDYEFDWEEVLSLTGYTGVYLQNAHARTNSILRKGGGAPAGGDASLLSLPEEQSLVRHVARFPETVAQAVEQNEPSVVSRYLLDLAAAFHAYFTAGNQEHSKRVLIDGNEPLRNARLALVDAVRITLATGLGLLGVATPEKM